MAYQMAATAMTLNDLEGHSSIACLFKCNPSNICAPFYAISTDGVLARFLCIGRASCTPRCTHEHDSLHTSIRTVSVSSYTGFKFFRITRVFRFPDLFTGSK